MKIAITLRNMVRGTKKDFKTYYVCGFCQEKASHTSCDTRIYFAFLSHEGNEVDVYHAVDHTCVAKHTAIRPTQIVSDALSYDITIQPSKIQGEHIVSQLRARDWGCVEKAVKDVSSLRQVSNEKIKQLQIIQPNQSYPAIKEMKDWLDQKDPFLIYKVDENEQLIFKSSRNQMKTASAMDYKGDHFLAKEYCGFDGNFKRVRDHVTLTASVYRPLLKQQKVLATMQA